MLIPVLPFLYFTGPTFNTLAFLPYWNIQLDVFHSNRSLHEFVIAHSTRVGSSLRQELQHWCQESCYLVRLFRIEMILFS